MLCILLSDKGTEERREQGKGTEERNKIILIIIARHCRMRQNNLII